MLFTQDGIDKLGIEVIKSLSIIIPVIVTVYFKDRKINKKRTADLKILATKVNNGFEKNGKEHNDIFQVIRNLNNEKVTLNQIRYAMTDASEYIASQRIKKILDVYSDELVGFTKDILATGFDRLTHEAVLIKFSNVKDRIRKAAKENFIEDMSIIDKYFETIDKHQCTYIEELKGIFKDTVNNKGSRFTTETLRYTQKVAHDTVLFLQQHSIK